MSPSRTPQRTVLTLLVLTLAGMAQNSTRSADASLQERAMYPASRQKAPIKKLQADIIVDDLGSGFDRYADVGDVNAHFISSEINDVTHAGHAYWANTFDVRDPAFFNVRAEWTPFFPSSGEYEVSAFIPRVQTGHADTSCAKYEISHRGGVSQVTVDQAAHTSEWVVLGKYSFAKSSVAPELLGKNGPAESVKLGYETCDNPGPTILFDAVRFRPIVAVDPRPTVTIDGGCDQTFTPGARITVRYSANVSEFYKLIVYRDPDFPTAHFVMNHNGIAGTGYTYESTADSTTKTGRFVLRLSDSGIDSSPCRYTVAAPAPPPTPAPSPAEVKGQVTTENGKPVLIARVDLESESGQSLDTSETDESGNYRFTGVAPNQSVRIKVSLESMDGSQKICWQNTGNCKTRISASTSPVRVGVNESRRVNIDLTSASLVYDAPDDEAKSLVARLATTRNYVVRVDLFRRQVLMNVSGKRVPAIIAADILIDENEPRYTTSTSPSMRRIRLGRNIVTHSSYLWSWVNPRKAIYHEAFHFAMDDAMGLPAIDDLNHGGYCNVSTTDSWTEGWATFWATVVDQEDGLTATAYPPFFYDLEWRNKAFDHYNESKCPKVRGFGSYEEIAVASLLLDYADGRTLERGDRVDTDIPRLWTALVGNGTVPQNMADVYHRLGNASLTNANGTTITRRDHDDLFVSHGFFSDKNGDWDFDRDEGEQPGYTADSKRPDRRFMPLRPTANVKANWPTRPGGLHPQNVIVDVASSGSTVSYSIPVSQATGHLVPIPVPPSAENVKILLRLQYPEFTAAPYEISGWDYASLVQDADPDSDHALAIDLPATKDASPGRYSRLFFPYVSRGDDPGSLPGPAPTIVARASNTSSPTSPRTPTSSRTRTLTPSVTPTPRVAPPTLTRVATSTPTVVMPPTLTPIPTSQCNFANLTLSSTDLTVSAGSTIPICYATYCRTRVRFLDCPDGQLCRIVFEGETTGLRTCESVVAYGPASRHIAKIQIIEGGSVLVERTVPFTVQAQTMIDGRFGRFTQVNDGCSTYALQPCSGRDVILHESDDEPSGQFKNWQNKNVRVFLIRAACGSNIAGSPIMSDMVIDRIERRDTECCRSPQASIAPDRGKDSTYFVGEEIKLTLDVTCTASVRLTRCPPGAPCSVAWRADAIEDRTVLLAKAEGRQSGQEKITVEVLVDNRVVSTSSTTYNIVFIIPLLCSPPGAPGN